MTKAERDQQHKNDLTYLMSTLSGRRVFGRIIAYGGMWRSSFVRNERGSIEYQEGMRQVALQLYHEMNTLCPKETITMLREMQNEKPVEEPRDPNDPLG